MKKRENSKYKRQNHNRHAVLGFFFSFLLLPLAGSSQTPPKVSATLDTTAITIGEQLHYNITVETDSATLVHFPEGQTFSPLETVAALPIDTIAQDNHILLQRRYALTQFDSGAYTIPPQRIALNEQPFFTDSFRIKVAGVTIDTTKQKLYAIKPLLEVTHSGTGLGKILLWILLGLIVTASLIYWFLLRKKPLTQAEQEALLPPYDRALVALKKLENSKYLIQDEYKTYYSELTTIVRSYLEEDIHITALESTTAQLMDKLELLNNSGKLKLEEETLTQFQKILQTADLVKFAKSKPSSATAEHDRKFVEQMVVKTHESLPEPTEEELSQNKEYVATLTKKKQRRRLYWIAGSLIGILFLGGVFATGYFGFKHVKETLLGTPTKTLWEGEWITSSYGFPPVALETPRVLLRQEVSLPPEIKPLLKQIQVFAYGSYTGDFAINTSSATYKNPIPPDFNAGIEIALHAFEKLGLNNIITKQEEFVTRDGTKGIKTYGTGNFKGGENNPAKTIQYNIFSFGGKGFTQQVVLTWKKGDSYAEQIVHRIINSIAVKTQT